MQNLEEYFVRRIGNFVIRPATYKDISKVISINWETLPEHYDNSFFDELMRDSPETFLVAEDGNEVIGYIMCRLEYGFTMIKRFGLAKKGHIVSVAVIESYRKKGIGIALVEEVMKMMRVKGCSETYLEVRMTNEPAVKLYEKLGFIKSSKIEKYYRDGEAALLMSFHLTSGA